MYALRALVIIINERYVFSWKIFVCDSSYNWLNRMQTNKNPFLRLSIGMFIFLFWYRLLVELVQRHFLFILYLFKNVDVIHGKGISSFWLRMWVVSMPYFLSNFVWQQFIILILILKAYKHKFYIMALNSQYIN